MDDISPQLLKAIESDFNRLSKESKTLSTLQKKILSKDATYQEANDYAIELGNILARAYKNNLSNDVLPNGRMYYNIAQKVIDPTMRNNFLLISKASSQVQRTLNKKANINVKVQSPKLNQDRINGIVQKVADAEKYSEVAWVLDEPIKNFSQSVVDDTIKANAEFHANLGMKPKIIRTVVGNCCDWCKDVAGVYTYPNVSRDVYRRHQRCRCKVSYDPNDGSKKVQDVWSKKWENPSKFNIVNARLEKLEQQKKKSKITFHKYSDKEIDELQNKSNVWYNNLEQDFKSVLDYYTTDGYFDINESLYASTGRCEEAIKDLHKALSTFDVTDNFICYRGCGKNEFIKFCSNKEGTIKEFKSTSLKEKVADGFMEDKGEDGRKIIFKVNAGSKGAYLGDNTFYDPEYEFLIDKDAMYRSKQIDDKTVEVEIWHKKIEQKT